MTNVQMFSFALQTTNPWHNVSSIEVITVIPVIIQENFLPFPIYKEKKFQHIVNFLITVLILFFWYMITVSLAKL